MDAEHLKYYSKTPPSELGLRVADLLDRWAGFHHIDPEQLTKCNWSHDRFVELKFDQASLSTFDFDDLTKLVFLAHDLCIRVEIKPVNMRFLCLRFHPRHVREGGMASRHPTLETAIEKWRAAHPLSETFSPTSASAEVV